MAWTTPGPGAPWSGGAGGRIPPCPPEAVSPGTIVRSTCPSADNVPDAPSPKPRGARSERSGMKESSALVPQRGHPLLTTIPHRSASGGKGACVVFWPLDPGCRGTSGLSYGSRIGKDVVGSGQRKKSPPDENIRRTQISLRRPQSSITTLGRELTPRECSSAARGTPCSMGTSPACG